jgi:hypothetical protein
MQLCDKSSQLLRFVVESLDILRLTPDIAA